MQKTNSDFAKILQLRGFEAPSPTGLLSSAPASSREQGEEEGRPGFSGESWILNKVVWENAAKIAKLKEKNIELRKQIPKL